MSFLNKAVLLLLLSRRQWPVVDGQELVERPLLCLNDLPDLFLP